MSKFFFISNVFCEKSVDTDIIKWSSTVSIMPASRDILFIETTKKCREKNAV